MDIFSISGRLVGFELPLFTIKADFKPPAPNFNDMISVVPL
jgi:hypothetical protein